MISAMLRQGFVLGGRQEPSELTTAPVLDGWVASPTPGGLRISTPEGEPFYEGDLGAAVPEGWHTSLADRGLLPLVLCSGVDLARDDRTEQMLAAGRAGRAVLAQVVYRPGGTG